MKMMFQTLVDHEHDLGTILEETAVWEEIIEIEAILARYSRVVISSCVFVSHWNFLESPDADFRQWGRKISKPSIKSSLNGSLSALLPSVVSLLNPRRLDPGISNYFRSMLQDTVNCREKPHVKCHDFMQLHIQIKNEGSLDEEHGFLMQNNHGNLVNQSGENDMYIPHLSRVYKHIHCCFSGGSALLKLWHFKFYTFAESVNGRNIFTLQYEIFVNQNSSGRYICILWHIFGHNWLTYSGILNNRYSCITFIYFPVILH